MGRREGHGSDPRLILMLSRFIVLSSFVAMSSLPCYAQNDTLYQRDSVIEVAEQDCTGDIFLNSERIADPAKVFVIAKNRRTYSLTSFMEANRMSKGGFTEYGLLDLDVDGKKELLLSNFTGGAHCCDEIYIFKNTGPSRYQYVAKTYAGHICLQGNTLGFSFYEHFGYFFTCYACGFPDTSDTAPLPVTGIRLQYRHGKLQVIPGDTELRSLIRDNLSKLSEQPYEVMDEISQDNGLRKEFALNLAVFYYSFGRNITETRNMFNQYYKYPDARKVWAEFYKGLLNVGKTNDF